MEYASSKTRKVLEHKPTNDDKAYLQAYGKTLIWTAQFDRRSYSIPNEVFSS